MIFSCIEHLLDDLCISVYLFLTTHPWDRYLTPLQVRKLRVRPEISYFIYHSVLAQKPCSWLLYKNTKHPIFFFYSPVTFPFVLEFSLFGFIYLFFPFLPCLAAGRVLVLLPGVGPEPVKWESRVQDTRQSHGSPETSPRGLWWSM